jgi:hypothetical protein
MALPPVEYVAVGLIAFFSAGFFAYWSARVRMVLCGSPQELDRILNRDIANARRVLAFVRR